MVLFDKVKKLFHSEKRYVPLHEKKKVWAGVRSTVYLYQENTYEKLQDQNFCETACELLKNVLAEFVL